MTKRKIKLIGLFNNGNIVVCDEKGQIPKLQKNPIAEVIRKARKMGYDVDDAEVSLPCGGARVLKGFDNYQVVG